MSELQIGVLGIIILLILFLTKMPIAFVMAFIGFLGFSNLVSLLIVVIANAFYLQLLYQKYIKMSNFLQSHSSSISLSICWLISTCSLEAKSL